MWVMGNCDLCDVYDVCDENMLLYYHLPHHTHHLYHINYSLSIKSLIKTIWTYDYTLCPLAIFWVIRSSIIAKMTIAKPASKPIPDLSR